MADENDAQPLVAKVADQLENLSVNQQGAMNATNHLVGQGHRRIAYLGDRVSIPSASQRFDGYTRALELARIDVNDDLVRHGVGTVDAAIRTTEELLAHPDPPTALFTSQNLVTIGVCRALHNLSVQDSVALVGFDDFPLADMRRPGISVIAQDSEGFGRLAAEILFRRLDGDDSPTTTHVVPTRLVTRGSGEIPFTGAQRG